MKYLIPALFGALLGSNVALWYYLRKATKTIKVLSQDEPIFRDLQLKYSLRGNNA